MTTPSSSTSNTFYLSTAGLASVSAQIPAGMDWFMIYSSLGQGVSVAFDNDAAIPLDLRTVVRRSMKRVTFSKRFVDTNPVVGYFIYGSGDPPEYPSIEDAAPFFYSLTAAAMNVGVGPGGPTLFEGYPFDDISQVRAVWVEVDAAAPNGVYLNEYGAVASGLLINPGDTRRIPTTAYQASLWNPYATTVQCYATLELVK
jgi:hypothetical protein